jgi:hypothetical protein
MTKNDLENKAISLMKERDSLNKQVKKLTLKNKKLNQQLILSGVSHRREPLLAYHKHLDSFNDTTIYNASESMIDDYLANNCG